jgi:16S rRNA processing protein RimM
MGSGFPFFPFWRRRTKTRKPKEAAAAPAADASRLVVVGRIGKAHGLRGEVRLEIEGPGEALRKARRVFVGPAPDGPRRLRVESLRGHTGRLLLKLEGVDDPEAARALTGALVHLRRSDFPEARDGEYYWADLIGARVRVHGGAGEDLGVIAEVVGTPAYDVLVVRAPAGEGGERLIPFTREALREVRLDEGLVLVNAIPEQGAGRSPSPRKSRDHATPRDRRGPKKS